MKIEFKRLSKVNLPEIFPVISEADYKLLSGQHLIISEADYNKIQSKGYLQVGPYQISKDLIQISSDNSVDPRQAKIQAVISKSSIYSEELVDVLFKGITLGKNVIMYGRGGHNKSEGTIQVLNEMKKEGLINSEPFVMSFGDGLTEESLFGGIKIKKFKDTGELEYLFENSFLEHEIVIFEEIFDAPPQILLSLKDVLTSKMARKGNQKHPMKTKIIIGLTNKSKEDFSEDDSLEALAQRFPLTLKVEWKSYEKNDWTKLFNTVFDKDFNDEHKVKLRELSEILSQNHKAQKSFCSPRTAVHAASLYCAGGDLKYISDIDNEVIDAYFKANKDQQQESEDATMFELIDQYIKDNKIEGLNTDEALLKIILGEHEERTGEKIELEDTGDKATKVKKLEFADALMNLHSWSRVNVDKSTRKRQEIKEIIEQLKK